MGKKSKPDIESADVFLSRELSWLSFARRVLAFVEDPELPLLERVKFAGILGMLHDEFFMKRVSGLKRRVAKGSTKRSIDGRLPDEELEACREELHDQCHVLASVLNADILPELGRAGVPITDYKELGPGDQKALRQHFEESVMPVLTPLAVDSEHPFPFISNLGLNLALTLPKDERGGLRFIRIKVPRNLPRWVPVPGSEGFTPIEQIIANNLDLMYPSARARKVHLFRVTRGAEGDPDAPSAMLDAAQDEPGSIIEQVGHELKARRFAGVVRLQVDPSMPKKLQKWLMEQLGIPAEDVYVTDCLLGLSDITRIADIDRSDLRFPPHEPVVHPRLRGLASNDSGAIFREIERGDILLHHPYHCFETSVLRFIRSASDDPSVLAIKLTIYRTSGDSPIVRALADAARRGKQVAVLVEVTARFDEAPNIAWGKFLEKEGVHVAYGVERLKTHVKLALVLRQEGARMRRYAHVGTGNYHPGTARIYEDVGVLTANDEICQDVTAVFNALTGATEHGDHRRLLVAPVSMRNTFARLIDREIAHVREGRSCGIEAKMNQLQDPAIIRKLYEAGQAGVPVNLIVRGLCCLRPGVPGLSETIRVSSVVGRFLEHSRIFRFENGGEPEHFLGSADWMKRNLSNRVETVMPVLDGDLRRQLDDILHVYATDNSSAWDCDAEGIYTRRSPSEGEDRRAAQDILIQRAKTATASPTESDGPQDGRTGAPLSPSARHK